MIEAMACGTPVIAWDRGSVPEIVEDGVTGFVVVQRGGGRGGARAGRHGSTARGSAAASRSASPPSAWRADYVALYRRLLARLMRTALLAWDYPPAPSGLSTAAREIAESLAEAGAEVTVFTLDRTGRRRVGGVAVVGLALPAGGALARLRLLGPAGHLAAPVAFRRAVLAAHGRAPFDVVEATNWYAPAALLAGRRGLPLVTRSSTPAAFTRDPAGTLRDRLDGPDGRSPRTPAGARAAPG